MSINDSYWTATMAQILEDHGVAFSFEQLAGIASDVAGAESVHAESAHGFVSGPPEDGEVQRLKAELHAERAKVTCCACSGRGFSTMPVGASHWSRETCPKCHGSGRA